MSTAMEPAMAIVPARARAKVGHDRAGGDGRADPGVGEGLAVVAEHGGAGLEAAAGQQDVAGDHHRAVPEPRVPVHDYS